MKGSNLRSVLVGDKMHWAELGEMASCWNFSNNKTLEPVYTAYGIIHFPQPLLVEKKNKNENIKFIKESSKLSVTVLRLATKGHKSFHLH